VKDILLRREAKEQRLPRYFTGRPCKHGHIAERYTSNNKCLDCNREQGRANHYIYFDKKQDRQKRYYGDNKDRIRAMNDRWAAEHPVKIKEIHKSWRDRNPDKIKERSARWYAENSDRSKANLQDWRRRNPAGYRLQKYRRRMLETTASGEFTEADLTNLIERQKALCTGCGRDISAKFTIDHKTPLSRGGTNDPENLQLLCRPCNSSKGTKTDEEWRNHSPE